MAWRYSASSYTPRDRSASRESTTTTTSKYGYPSSSPSSYTASERPSRWSSSTSIQREPVSRSTSLEEHGPVWAKTSLHSNPSSVVQRLKDRYGTQETTKSETQASTNNRSDAKDLSLPITKKYGRSTTTSYNLGNKSLTETKRESREPSLTRIYGSKLNLSSGIKDLEKPSSLTSAKSDSDKGLFISRASLRKRSPEPEKTSTYEYRTRKPDYTPMESKPKVYTSSSLGSSPATSRYLGNKSRSGSSAGSTPNTPTTPSTDRNYILEKFERAQREQEEKKSKTVVMVTRSTSPSLPSASVYVRTRRADSSKTIEKTVQRPDFQPTMLDKESQVDESLLKVSNKFSTYSTDKVKPRASYGVSSGITSYTPISRYSGRATSYTPLTSSRYETSELRKSVSRDNPPSISIDLKSSKEVSPNRSTLVNQTETLKSPNYTPLTSSRYETSELRKSLCRDNPPSAILVDLKTSSKEVSPNRSPLVGQSESPKTSITSPPIRPNSIAPVKEVSKTPSPSVSTSEKITKTSILKTNSKSTIEATSKKGSSLVLNKTRDKSSTPNSEENKRSRSKTQESDTSISVSGFSDISHSKPSLSVKPSMSDSSKKVPKKVETSSISDSSKKVLKKVDTSSISDSSKKIQKKVESSESESESESDETATTTDSDTADDVEELTKSSEPSSLKKSITNFLQNIPNPTSVADLAGSRSRLSLFRKSGSSAKIKFKHVESGERAWWLDSSSNVPEGISIIKASNKSINNIADKLHLPENLLINRQYSKDKDWLKNSSDELSDRSGTSPSRVMGGSSPIQQQSISESCESSHRVEGDSTIFLEVPKLPVVRQWSDEKPWWQTENDNSSKENSISINVGDTISNNELYNSTKSNCDIQLCVEDKIACDKSERASPGKSFKLVEEDGEDIDVTPALRRRREQQQAGLIEEAQDIPDYQMKINRELEEKANNVVDKRLLLDECKLECSVRDLTQKLAAVANGLGNSVEGIENILEAGEMSGMISKAKAELMKSQTKQFSRQTSEDITEPVKDIEKSEIDGYWKELVDSLDRPLKLGDLDFTDLTSEDEKEMLGNTRLNGVIPPPPPLFMANGPVPAPPLNNNPPPPMMFNAREPIPPPQPIPKSKKTVKLFWKEVSETMFPMKTEDGAACVWDELYPVNVDYAKLEHLFESRAKDIVTKKQQDQNKTKAIVVLDNKRSNAINIGMTKLPPPRAIKAAILKMDSSVVTKEGIEKLLIMLPTEEERVRIQDAQALNPELPLGSAEQFLLTLASISELEARLKLWSFKMDYENNEKEICEPLLDLKQGIHILRNNRTFRGILSTLLSIGNFLNGQDAKGFQIEYLSKVPEVKDTVNKHSLLHHLCVFVMEKFPDSTDLYSEIGTVVRASKTDFDELTANIKKVEDECKCSWNHLKIIAKNEGQTAMKAKMSDFLADCAERIILIGIVHRRIMCRFHKFVKWLGMPMNRISTTRPQELFKTIAEFSLEYRTTRERILQQLKKVSHHREKSRSRCNLINENSIKKLNSKEAKEDAKLRQLLGNEGSVSETVNQTATWRRHKKKPDLAVESKEDDSEILETLIKTAKQPPTSRETFKERRRSRISERKNVSLLEG